jgi:hypothetical protein
MPKICRLYATLAGVSFLAAAAVAQPGPGMGGPGGGWGGWKWNSSNVPGWQMMTPEERKEHQDKMHGMKTYDECKGYHEAHRKLMEQRAKDKGVTLATPRSNPCDMMRVRGIFK